MADIQEKQTGGAGIPPGEMSGGGAADEVRKQPGEESRGMKALKVAAVSVVFAVGLAFSVAFPFGIGVFLFMWLLVVAGALVAVGYSSVKLFKAMMGTSTSFGYNPAESYLAGKKGKARKREPEDDAKKDDDA
jgi:hypothetical protein